MGEEKGRRRKAEGAEAVGEKEAGEVVRMKGEEAGEDKSAREPVEEVGDFGMEVVVGKKWAGGGRTEGGGRGSEGAEEGRTGDGEGEEGEEEEGGSTIEMMWLGLVEEVEAGGADSCGSNEGAESVGGKSS